MSLSWSYLAIHLEPMGAQIQSPFAVPCGLAAKLMRLPLAVDSEFYMS